MSRPPLPVALGATQVLILSVLTIQRKPKIAHQACSLKGREQLPFQKGSFSLQLWEVLILLHHAVALTTLCKHLSVWETNAVSICFWSKWLGREEKAFSKLLPVYIVHQCPSSRDNQQPLFIMTEEDGFVSSSNVLSCNFSFSPCFKVMILL